ncbi:MAG TPA: alpha/beta hydrolase [Candidatus Limnocylindria bacterium]|nr:alpha/beta hydrolase [Candidatus Limnocylindria bacterium]
MARRPWAVLVLASLLACGPPIAVKRLGLDSVHKELTGNVLTTGRPSTHSWIELQKRGLAERWEHDPAGTLADVHGELAAGPPNRALGFAATELSFAHAMRGGGRAYYLASVLYAWDFLFGAGPVVELDALDPRPRLAADIYNVALARAFESDEKKARVVLEAGPRVLPFGTLEVAFDPETARWGRRRLVDFRAASELGVRGLRNRYRTWGIGAPLNAATRPIGVGEDGQGFVYPKIRVPVTLLLRPDPTLQPAAPGVLHARLELLSDQQTVDIAGRVVPLEYEPTSALAQALAEGDPWRLELPGFLGGNLIEQQKVTRLGGLEPYKPGKIPVVLVHGTASSAARWAEMLNDLSNDDAVRLSYQFWLFSYDTGNPILYSALQLRRALTQAVERFDPQGTNACLRQMVLVGHSQGGLLAKLMVVESGDRFWRNVSDEPFDEVPMAPEARALLQEGMFVSPLPFVREVIFIATPHGGSYQAGGLVRRVLQRLVNFPTDLARLSTDIVTDSEAGMIARQFRRLPTSVDNMAPGSPFVRALGSLPVVPGVGTHSIIPVLGDGPLAQGRDGVVAYRSAHIEPVDSELVVRPSGHSTQGNPRTIEEVRRILLEHAARVYDGDHRRAAGLDAP